jgi:hypothetical protein
MVQMSGVEDEAEVGSPGCEGAGESDRVGTAGETDGEAKAGAQQGCVEWESRKLCRGGHWMIVNRPDRQDLSSCPRRCILHWLCRYLPYSPRLALGRAWPRLSPSNFWN